MGTPPPASAREKSSYLMTLVNSMTDDYKNTLSGKYVANAKIESIEIGKGAIIKNKFKQIFNDYTKDNYKCSF